MFSDEEIAIDFSSLLGYDWKYFRFFFGQQLSVDEMKNGVTTIISTSYIAKSLKY